MGTYVRRKILIVVWLTLWITPRMGDATEPIDFTRDIRPILANHCFACHGPDHQHREAGLRLDLPQGVTSQLESGAYAVVSGNPEESELVARIFSDDEDKRMPPPETNKELTDEHKILLKRWIASGARYTQHWSFRPLLRPPIPTVINVTWIRNPIDAFIVARLEKEGIEPSPEADRRTLIRRLNLDLIGLPPSPNEVHAFAHEGKDPARNTYDGLVDHLLDSKHYGERMAIYWLDLVRYADSVGYHGDQNISVWPYRDYVIEAFNSNMLFDQFTREQLAGDLIPSATSEQRIAAVYNRLGMMTAEGGAQDKEYLAKYAADRVRTASTIWLGATMGCAECHDHKFDPFTMRDFYSFAAFFSDIREKGFYRAAHITGIWGEMMEMPTEQQSADRQRLQARIATAKEKIAESFPQPDAVHDMLKRDEEQLKTLEHEIEKMPVTRSTDPRVMRVLPRGNWMDETGPVVVPAVPAFLPQPELDQDQRLTRLDLANWLMSDANPLTARTFVNRLWKLYFGAGLSRSLDDLGSQGQPPTHPKLLDWLAAEFVESGWNIKHTVRLIVTSAAYRQTSRVSMAMRERDPCNLLCARQSRFQLDAELIRDNALAISGLLVCDVGGRSTRPYQSDGYYAQLNFPKREY